MDARLIRSPADRGERNMAIDEGLLESARSGAVTLRFYTWSSPTVSLGYFQAWADRQGHAPSRGCPLVRRSTGGGAIVHDRELTYSFTCPARSRTQPNPMELYWAFHDTLVAELRQFGLPAALHQAPGGSDEPFLCFQRRSPGDVVCGGDKICGSAQRRDRGAVLIHGSLLLEASPQAPELPGIHDLARGTLDASRIDESWSRRIAERLGIRWTESVLSSAEQQRADEWTRNRFGTPEWNRRR